MRLFFQLAVAALASAGAFVSYEIWTAAAANSASPGAIVLLGIAGFCGLIAFLACIGVVIELARLLRRWPASRCVARHARSAAID